MTSTTETPIRTTESPFLFAVGNRGTIHATTRDRADDPRTRALCAAPVGRAWRQHDDADYIEFDADRETACGSCRAHVKRYNKLAATKNGMLLSRSIRNRRAWGVLEALGYVKTTADAGGRTFSVTLVTPETVPDPVVVLGLDPYVAIGAVNSQEWDVREAASGKYLGQVLNESNYGYRPWTACLDSFDRHQASLNDAIRKIIANYEAQEVSL
jgi:hypothetical protein